MSLPPRSGAPATPLLRRVSVRALCAFGAKAGDLDLRFTPSPSAQEGIAGHQLVQPRGPPATSENSRSAAEFEPAGGARPCRRLRPGAQPARRDQDPPRRPAPPARQPPRTCTGPRPRSTAGCCVRRAGWTEDRSGAGVLRHRAASEGDVLRQTHCRANRCAPSSKTSARASWPGPRRKRRTAPARGRACGARLPARRLPRRPARTGRSRLPRGRAAAAA
jgi:hypothetical protein